jgi:hypothetical protein
MVDWLFGTVDCLYGAVERLYEMVEALSGMPECHFEGVGALFKLPERSNGTVYHFLRWAMG